MRPKKENKGGRDLVTWGCPPSLAFFSACLLSWNVLLHACVRLGMQVRVGGREEKETRERASEGVQSDDCEEKKRQDVTKPTRVFPAEKRTMRRTDLLFCSSCFARLARVGESPLQNSSCQFVIVQDDTCTLLARLRLASP